MIHQAWRMSWCLSTWAKTRTVTLPNSRLRPRVFRTVRLFRKVCFPFSPSNSLELRDWVWKTIFVYIQPPTPTPLSDYSAERALHYQPVRICSQRKCSDVVCVILTIQLGSCGPVTNVHTHTLPSSWVTNTVADRSHRQEALFLGKGLCSICMTSRGNCSCRMNSSE